MKTSPVLSVCWQQGYEIRQDSLNIANRMLRAVSFPLFQYSFVTFSLIRSTVPLSSCAR